MSRAEFSNKVKLAALERAKNHCEAVGAWYGMLPGARCGARLNGRYQFDHIILDANSHDNSLENCCVCCLPCHRVKTRTLDIPVAAKTVRQKTKHLLPHEPSRSFRKPAGYIHRWSRARG